ncbi:MAG: hypothetical protein IT383_15255 [Deltaproteobacteria bacterium]|nr:hypothetical protein [Deltaproteobacteria bacterium]
MTLRGALPITIAAFLTAGSIACQAPASVDGVFAGQDFSLRCESPLAASDASGRDSVVVLSEATSETLSTVNVRLRRAAELPIGKPVSVGTDEEGHSTVQVVVGALVVETRADGVEILSAADPTRASSVAGTLTIESRDDDGVAGSFAAELDDGGFVEGFFAAANTR